MIEKAATDIYTFENLRKGQYTYVDKFRLSGKPVTLIGIAFSTRKRAVSATKIVRDA